MNTYINVHTNAHTYIQYLPGTFVGHANAVTPHLLLVQILYKQSLFAVHFAPTAPFTLLAGVKHTVFESPIIPVK
jgi:hypothetical protein